LEWLAIGAGGDRSVWATGGWSTGDVMIRRSLGAWAARPRIVTSVDLRHLH
jgi:hypothetical protein